MASSHGSGMLGRFAFDVAKDDRGRWVCEVWDKASGQTVSIEGHPSAAAARQWGAAKLAELANADRPDPPGEFPAYTYS
jgi:hypothetical protein